MNIHIKARTVPYILVLGGKEKKKKKKEKKKKKSGKYIEKSQRICRASIYVEFGWWMEDADGAHKARGCSIYDAKRSVGKKKEKDASVEQS